MYEDLATLIAKDKINHGLAAYCRGMDRVDDNLAKSLWHPDGEAIYELVFEGPGDGFATGSLNFIAAW